MRALTPVLHHPQAVTDTIRRAAQVVLMVISVVAAASAALIHFGQTPEQIFGPHLRLVPATGPVGIRPFVEFVGFGDREVTASLCPAERSPTEECVELVKGPGSGPVRANAIPPTFPSGDEIVPAPYPVRVGPDEGGDFPVRARFEITTFKLGPEVRARSLREIEPQGLSLGEPREIARSVDCRPPVFLPDGRLAVGRTVYDPSSGVTIDFQIAGAAELLWSPQGDKLAILTADRKEIRLAAPDGSDPVTSVREARGLLSSLSWSHEGDRLAFIAQNDPAVPRLGPGPPTVNIVNATTGERTTAGPGQWVAWDPAGDVFAVQMSGPAIELGNPGGGRRGVGAGRRPAWSADGRMLAFVRGDEGSSEGWVSLADGTKASPVVAADACALSFSSDNRSVAIVERRGDATRLVLRAIENPLA